MLEHLFDAELVYRSEIEPLTEEGEGELVGSGDGTVTGPALAGGLAWTLFERPGRLVCAMNPVAVIETSDGAQVRVEARGFALRWRRCAIDALGIAPMPGLPVEIYSRDPLGGGQIWVRLDIREGAWWEPDEAVVLSGSAGCEGPSFPGCCDVLNFFETRENAERYLVENASVSGQPLSIPEAIEAGRIVFGDVFTEMD
jgi:Alkylmercury lyase